MYLFIGGKALKVRPDSFLFHTAPLGISTNLEPADLLFVLSAGLQETYQNQSCYNLKAQRNIQLYHLQALNQSHLIHYHVLFFKPLENVRNITQA